MGAAQGKAGARYRRRILGALLLATGLAAGPFVQALPYLQQFSYFKKLKEAEAAVDAPAVFARLEAMDPQQRAAFVADKYGRFDTLRTMRSLSGDATGAAQASVWFDVASGSPARYAAQDGKALESAAAEDAIAAIVREAGKRQVVILNEAHHIPLHRVFAAKLARELRKIGYEYLAAEAFSNEIPLHPTAVERSMGFYVMEPMYAGFVRSAMRDGWSFIGYDHYAEAATQAERNRLREVGAARNLVEKIFSKDPKAKVFMYVGYGHAMKQQEASQDGWKSVATLLRDQLGIDPLSIEQTTMYGRGDVRVDHPQYRAAMTRLSPSKAIVLKGATGGYAVLAGRPGGYDMQVFHPDETMHGPHGRPLWMERQAGLRAHPVPTNLLPASGRRLIQAFHAGDGAGAIPADQVMVEAGKPAPALMLPEGQFRYGVEE